MDERIEINTASEFIKKYQENNRFDNIVFENTEEKKKLITLLKESNEGDFLYLLATFYKIGLYVKKNYSDYLLYLTLASEKDYGIALLELALEYHKNDELPEAHYYMKKAADNNVLSASYYLSYFYFSGEKMPLSKEEALKYLIKDSNAGVDKALYLLGTFYLCGLYVEQNRKMALELIDKAAQKGYKKAEDLFKKLEK